MNNVIKALSSRYTEWILWLDPSTFTFVLNATYLYGFPLLLCSLTYDGENTRFFRQWFMLLIGVLLAFMLPAGVPTSPMLKTWVFTLALFGLMAMPAILPVFLVATPPFQNRLRIVLYLTLGLLFVANQGGMLQ